MNPEEVQHILSQREYYEGRLAYWTDKLELPLHKNYGEILSYFGGEEGALHALKLLVSEAEKLNESKGADYQGKRLSFIEYYPHGLRDLFLQINRKAKRLQALIGDGIQKPNHESIRQNAIDLAAFAFWLAAFIDLGTEQNDSTQP